MIVTRRKAILAAEQALKLAMEAHVAQEKAQAELRGALMLNYVLTKRLGGDVVVPQSEMDSVRPGSRLHVTHDSTREEWILACETPEQAAEPVVPPSLIEVVSA